jgi:hypothetical protein
MTAPTTDARTRRSSLPAPATSAVLEYRVWCHLREGDDVADGDDYFCPYATFEEAQDAAARLAGATAPLALVLQREYLEEGRPGEYRHVVQERMTEWPVEFLDRPRRDERTIAGFLAPNAPANRLEILRGQAPRK